MFFFETLNFKVAKKLVAWELGDGFGTIRKVFLYSSKKHWVYALLNQVVRSYGLKSETRY